MEASTFCLAAGAEEFKKLGVATPTRIQIVGGGSASPLWCQTITDCLQIECHVPDVEESAASGAALQAAAAWLGADVRELARERRPAVRHAYEPQPALAEVYRDALLRHQTTGRHMFGDDGDK